MDSSDLFKNFLPPILAVSFAGIALVVYIRRYRARTQPDTGQFELKSWKLEEELATNEPPRPVKPKDVSRQKKTYLLILSLPFIIVTTVFFLFATKMKMDLDHFAYKEFSFLLVLPIVCLLVIVVTQVALKKKIEKDLKILSLGTAIGAKVMNVHRQKSQYSFRLQFAWNGNVYERIVYDQFHNLHKTERPSIGEELTILIDPQNVDKSATIYRQMLAVIGTPSPF